MTHLFLAVHEGHTNTAKTTMLDNGATPLNMSRDDGIFTSLRNGNLETLNLVIAIEKKFVGSKSENQGFTPFTVHGLLETVH
jgi:hypothetical protein